MSAYTIVYGCFWWVSVGFSGSLVSTLIGLYTRRGLCFSHYFSVSGGWRFRLYLKHVGIYIYLYVLKTMWKNNWFEVRVYVHPNLCISVFLYVCVCVRACSVRVGVCVRKCKDWALYCECLFAHREDLLDDPWNCRDPTIIAILDLLMFLFRKV